MTTNNFRFKLTYLHEYMAMALVRIADDAILYVNDNELLVRTYAEGFCGALGEKFFIE